VARTAFPGRQAVLDKLLKIRQADKLGQPFLLTGPEGSGKENTALEFARLLNCSDPEFCCPDNLCESCVKALSFQHPDIRWIGPAPATVKEAEVRELLDAKIANPFFQPSYAATSYVSIGDPENPTPLSIRSLIHFLRRRAFQSPYKVAVVNDAHRMNVAAANAFLKTLEEPPPNTVIFLLSTGTEGMLPTILSRCQKVRFEPWPEDELTEVLCLTTGCTAEEADLAVRVSDGNARRAVALLQPEAGMLLEWSGQLFQWITQGNRVLASVAADELHRGLMGHTVLPEGMSAKSTEAKETAARRDRAIRLCELLNLHYSDTVGTIEMGQEWRPRLPGSAQVVSRAAESRRTDTLLKDMALIDASRRDIDANLNIGLAMAVLFEGLIENAEHDRQR
jgi:DNA polymerase III delta prime subunit